MAETAFCYHCRQHHPLTEMRRVGPESSEAATADKPKHTQPSNQRAVVFKAESISDPA